MHTGWDGDYPKVSRKARKKAHASSQLYDEDIEIRKQPNFLSRYDFTILNAK